MCQKACTILLSCSFPATLVGVILESLDAWERQMTTSSRYVTLRPGSLRLDTCFFLLTRCSSDKEHCTLTDVVRLRIQSRRCLPNYDLIQ